MIYLASPYSHPDADVRWMRFEMACTAAANLMGRGEIVFSPIAHSHSLATIGSLPTDWDYWEKVDRHFIEVCDSVWVLMLDGWEESKGVHAEIAIAESLGKSPVYWGGE